MVTHGTGLGTTCGTESGTKSDATLGAGLGAGLGPNLDGKVGCIIGGGLGETNTQQRMETIVGASLAANSWGGLVADRPAALVAD